MEQGQWDPAELVAAGYDAAAEAYRLLEEEEWPRLRWLRVLLERLPPASHVLDLGCGSALPAGAEIARRHRLVGVDVSARQVQLARSNVADASFIRADMMKLTFPRATFDAVVSFYAIGHIPRERHVELFARIHRWLRPNGLLLVSEEDADRPSSLGEWLGQRMFLSTFPAPTMLRLLGQVGFVVLAHAVEVQREQGVEVPYTWVFARRDG